MRTTELYLYFSHSLTSENITDDAVQSLGDALKGNTTLKSLRLGYL